MTNKFNQFIKKGLLINLGLLFLAIIVAATYMEDKDLSFNDLVNETNWHIGSGNISSLNINWDNDHSASKYETIVMHEETTFDVTDHIEIESTIEDIQFIHEDRDTIKVVFDRELPDTSRYKLNYVAKESNKGLTIKSTISVNNIFTDLIYKGSITIYVPEDYQCESLLIESDMAKYNNLLLPKSVNNLILIADVANIELDITQPIKNLSIKANAGNLILNIDQTIDDLKIDCDSSNTNIEVNAPITNVNINTDIGNINATFNVSPSDMHLLSDIGKITLDFYDDIKTLDVSTDIGDVRLNLLETDKATVYKSIDLGSFSSDQPLISNKKDAQIYVSTDLGSVRINAINELLD